MTALETAAARPGPGRLRDIGGWLAVCIEGRDRHRGSTGSAARGVAEDAPS